jgi:transcriptional regulator
MKNHWQTISTEEKLDVISQSEKGERIVDICRNVRFTHISMCTVHDNAGRNTERANSETKLLVWQDYHSPITMNHTKNYGSVSYIFIA